MNSKLKGVAFFKRTFFAKKAMSKIKYNSYELILFNILEVKCFSVGKFLNENFTVAEVTFRICPYFEFEK